MINIRTRTSIYSFFILLLLTSAWACRKKSERLPLITTIGAKAMGPDVAVGTGHLYFSGDEEVTAKGFCWSTSPDPDIEDAHSEEDGSEGGFSTKMTGLKSRTLYYACAYATSELGTSYGKPFTFVTSLEGGSSMTDNSGNVYPTVRIGNQIWMAENLRGIHFRNGQSIGSVTQNSWLPYTSPLWCYYDNQSSNDPDLGKLYNFYAVSDTRNIAPPGWHVPTVNDWLTLINHFPDSYAAAESLKNSKLTKYWGAYAGNDSCGFNAIPAGIRSGSSFFNRNNQAYYWTSTLNGTYAYYMTITYTNQMGYSSFDKFQGLSIRLVKD